MALDFIVKEYHAGDEERIVELLEIAFNGWPHFDLRAQKGLFHTTTKIDNSSINDNTPFPRRYAKYHTIQQPMIEKIIFIQFIY